MPFVGDRDVIAVGTNVGRGKDGSGVEVEMVGVSDCC